MTDTALRIGLIAPKGTGKTTFAHTLRDTYGFDLVSFADPIRYSVVTAVNAFLADQQLPDRVTLENMEMDKDAFRLGMQWLGTEIVRQHVQRPTHWIDKALFRINQLERRSAAQGSIPAIVVDDVRFVNEAEALRDRGFTLIRLRRRGAGGYDDPHVSEQEYRLIEADETLSVDHGTAEETAAVALEFGHKAVTYALWKIHRESPTAHLWYDRISREPASEIQQEFRQIGGVKGIEAFGRPAGPGVGSVQDE